MAGSVTGLHLFGPDTGPEALSLLDGNYGTLTTALNTLSNFSNYYIDSGAVNALVVTVPAPQVFSLTDGVALDIQVAVTTTSTVPTLNVNAGGAKTIVYNDGSALAVGALVAGGRYRVQYDGAAWRVITLAGASSPLAFSSLTVGPPSGAITTLTVNNSTSGAQTTAKIASTFTSLAASPLLSLISTASTPFAILSISANGTVGTDDFALIQNGANRDAQVFNRASGGAMLVGTNGTGALTLVTNNTTRVTLSSNGNLTLAAPASGVAFTLTGVGANNAITVNASSGGIGMQVLAGGAADIQLALSGAAAGQQGALRFDANAAVAGFIGSSGAANQLITGSAAGDLNLRTQGGALNISTNSGGSRNALILSGAGAAQFPSVGTTASAANAFLDNAASNNLLRSTSSRRYKTDIESLTSDITGQIYRLRPIRYRSKAPADDSRVWWYGLIAEEVAYVEPRLVHYDGEGRPDGVQYDRVAVLVLAELQQLRREFDQHCRRGVH